MAIQSAHISFSTVWTATTKFSATRFVISCTLMLAISSLKSGDERPRSNLVFDINYRLAVNYPESHASSHVSMTKRANVSKTR